MLTGGTIHPVNPSDMIYIISVGSDMVTLTTVQGKQQGRDLWKGA